MVEAEIMIPDDHNQEVFKKMIASFDFNVTVLPCKVESFKRKLVPGPIR